jgi:hypothetical protein
MTHENSIKVKIFRAQTHLGGSQGPEVQAYMGEAKVSIGSYFEPNSIAIGSGLTFAEKEVLLPQFVGVSSTHPDFMKKVETYYIDLETKVPYGTGLTLEVGLTEDNNKPVSAKNLPLNIVEFVRFRHASKHPFVGATKEEAEGTRKLFYIFNAVELEKKKQAIADVKDAALAIFLEIKADARKVKMMLTLLGVDTKVYNGSKIAAETMQADLRKLAETKPKEFIEIYSRKSFESEYMIQAMINLGIIKQYGSKYMNPSNHNALLASSLEELVFYFKDDENSETILALKAQLQEKTGEQPSKE